MEKCYLATLEFFGMTEGCESIHWYRGYIAALYHSELINHLHVVGLTQWVSENCK